MDAAADRVIAGTFAKPRNRLVKALGYIAIALLLPVLAEAAPITTVVTPASEAAAVSIPAPLGEADSVVPLTADRLARYIAVKKALATFWQAPKNALLLAMARATASSVAVRVGRRTLNVGVFNYPVLVTRDSTLAAIFTTNRFPARDFEPVQIAVYQALGTLAYSRASSIALPDLATTLRRNVALVKERAQALAAVGVAMGPVMPDLPETASGWRPPTTAAAEVRVAQARVVNMTPGKASGDKVVLPVVVDGDSVSMMLDVGTVETILNPALNPASGVKPASTIDSLVIGSTVQRNVPVQYANIVAPIPIPDLPPLRGVIGTSMLSHYDLLFDAPARRVDLYAPPPLGPASPVPVNAWYPAGITAADCSPLVSRGARAPGIVGVDDVRANGQPMHSIFDSGAQPTIMNIPAARALGITRHSPGVQLLPPDSSLAYPGTGPMRNYEVTGLHVRVGIRTLTAGPAIIVQRIPEYFDENLPELDLGLDAFRDRKLFVSYSTGQVCVGRRERPR
ncbi:MAG: hypothetical protein ACYCVE_16440 [Gemmatimonadaceae bacterium]